MDYFPLFIKTKNCHVVMVGGGTDIVHKLRLMLKTTAEVHVFGAIEDASLADFCAKGAVQNHDRAVTLADTQNAAFAYIGVDDNGVRDAAMAIFDEAGLPYCVIDDKARSNFITPALVDRDPIVVAIGSEGTGPVIIRDIKAKIEDILPDQLGIAAKVAGAFRPFVETLEKGAERRKFWSHYIKSIVPNLLKKSDYQLSERLTEALHHSLEQAKRGGDDLGHDKAVDTTVPVIIAADADLLTRQAMGVLNDADMLIYDGVLPRSIAELSRRESLHLVLDRQNPAASFAQLQSHLQNGLKAVVISGKALDEFALAVFAPLGKSYPLDVLPHVSIAGDEDVFPLLPRGDFASQPFLRKV